MSISNKLNEIYNQLEQLTHDTPLEDIEPQDEGVVAHIRLMLDQLTGQKHPTVDWDSFHRPGVPHVYMLWAHPEGEDLDSQVELRAICSNRERAEEYKKAVEHESEYRSNTYRMVYIEQRRLNHFYCPGMIYALRDIPIPDDVSEEVKAELRETLGRDKE